MMTWRELKTTLDARGITDDAVIAYIDISGRPDLLVATQTEDGWAIHEDEDRRRESDHAGTLPRPNEG